MKKKNYILENNRQILMFFQKIETPEYLTNKKKDGIIFKTQMKMQGRKDEEYEREDY